MFHFFANEFHYDLSDLLPQIVLSLIGLYGDDRPAGMKKKKKIIILLAAVQVFISYCYQ